MPKIKHSSAPKTLKQTPPPTKQPSFSPKISLPSTPLSNGTYWRWKGAEDYKNDILKRYQIAMESCGIPRKNLKPFVMQIIQENGALDPNVIGDYGYSYGLGQWYMWPTKAVTYLKKHPQERDLEHQVKKLAEDACGRYTQFGTDIFLAVVAHNSPKAAHLGKDSCRYISRVNSKGKKYLEWSCYWADEVSLKENLLTL